MVVVLSQNNGYIHWKTILIDRKKIELQRWRRRGNVWREKKTSFARKKNTDHIYLYTNWNTYTDKTKEQRQRKVGRIKSFPDENGTSRKKRTPYEVAESGKEQNTTTITSNTSTSIQTKETITMRIFLSGSVVQCLSVLGICVCLYIHIHVFVTCNDCMEAVRWNISRVWVCCIIYILCCMDFVGFAFVITSNLKKTWEKFPLL